MFTLSRESIERTNSPPVFCALGTRRVNSFLGEGLALFRGRHCGWGVFFPGTWSGLAASFATLDLAAGTFFCWLGYLGVVCVKEKTLEKDVSTSWLSSSGLCYYRPRYRFDCGLEAFELLYVAVS